VRRPPRAPASKNTAAPWDPMIPRGPKGLHARIFQPASLPPQGHSPVLAAQQCKTVPLIGRRSQGERQRAGGSWQRAVISGQLAAGSKQRSAGSRRQAEIAGRRASGRWQPSAVRFRRRKPAKWCRTAFRKGPAGSKQQAEGSGQQSAISHQPRGNRPDAAHTPGFLLIEDATMKIHHSIFDFHGAFLPVTPCRPVMVPFRPPRTRR
jgi:hypothetical protein